MLPVVHSRNLSRFNPSFVYRFEAGTGGEIDGKKMRTFEESVKSQKTVASMIENPNNNKAKKAATSKPAVLQEDEEEDQEQFDEGDIGFDQIQANRMAMMSKKKKVSGVKSPKAGKNPKKKTTWDKTMFGGNVNSEDIKSLDR